MTTSAFQKELERAGRRMADGIVQAAARVLANGGTELARGAYYRGGPVVVVLKVPAGTWHVNGREVETHTYREEDEAKVLELRDRLLAARARA